MRNTNRTTSQFLILAAAGLAYTFLFIPAARAAEDSEPARFATPDEAVAALTQAVRAQDTNALRSLFGPALNEIANPDPVQRQHNLTLFAGRLAEAAKLSRKDDHTVVLIAGKDDWPFAIPVVKKDDKWFFDTQAGKEEILNRRIGANELNAIDVCRAYVQAQRDYARKDSAGNGVMEYAQKLRSSPGQRDGLYWETKPDEEQSPFGPLVAKAYAEGYGKNNPNASAQTARLPFHGYFFRILTRQGQHTPGGKYDYIINDHMVAGFALLAYPAVWGNSGVMTFTVNQQGKVYQKNLGEKTAELAEKTKEYDPGDTWEPVK
jgi:hypothetical protein